MYQKIEGNIHFMTDVEVSEEYPDSYILMRRDEKFGDGGEVLFIADTMAELFPLVDEIDDLDESFYGIVEGFNHQRSLGGVVIGG